MQAKIEGHTGASEDLTSATQALSLDKVRSKSEAVKLFSGRRASVHHEGSTEPKVSGATTLSKPYGSENNRKLSFSEPVVMPFSESSADEIDFTRSSSSDFSQPSFEKKKAKKIADGVFVQYCRPENDYNKIKHGLLSFAKDDTAVHRLVSDSFTTPYLHDTYDIACMVSECLRALATENEIGVMQAYNKENEQCRKEKLAAFRSYLEKLTGAQKQELSELDNSDKKAMRKMARNYWKLAGHKTTLLDDDEILYDKVKKIIQVSCAQLASQPHKMD